MVVAPHRSQLREFVRSKDVDGMVSTEAEKGQALAFSRSLLLRAIGTKDVGIFEAAMNCVVGRCERLAGKVSVFIVRISDVADWGLF